MIEGTRNTSLAILCRVRRTLLAVPVSNVVETMRPQPVSPIADTPSFVVGLSVIRGVPTPVVDLGRALGLQGESNVGRFLTIRSADRQIALAVQEVVGVRALDADSLDEMPPALGSAAADFVAAVGAHSSELLLFLEAARVVPDSVWLEIDRMGGAA